MSEITTAVLRMPPELWNTEYIDVYQRHVRYLMAADEIEHLREINDLMLEVLIDIAGDESVQRLPYDLHKKARAAIQKARTDK